MVENVKFNYTRRRTFCDSPFAGLVLVLVLTSLFPLLELVLVPMVVPLDAKLLLASWVWVASKLKLGFAMGDKFPTL